MTATYMPGDWEHDPVLKKRIDDAAQRANPVMWDNLLDRFVSQGKEKLSFKICLGCRAVVTSGKAEAHVTKCDKVKRGT